MAEVPGNAGGDHGRTLNPSLAATSGALAPAGASFVYMHRGEGGCGKPAFYLNRIPAPGEKFSATDVVNRDGTPVAEIPQGLMVICDSCERNVYGPRVAFVEAVGG